MDCWSEGFCRNCEIELSSQLIDIKRDPIASRSLFRYLTRMTSWWMLNSITEFKKRDTSFRGTQGKMQEYVNKTSTRI